MYNSLYTYKVVPVYVIKVYRGSKGIAPTCLILALEEVKWIN
jgi:hypothetical protein